MRDISKKEGLNQAIRPAACYPEGIPMESSKKYVGIHALSRTAILVHFGLAVVGIAALCSGLFADDYKNIAHWGFSFHRWIGISTASIVLLRVLLGVVGPYDLRFSNWVPYTRERFSYVKEDLGGLRRLDLPPRPPHFGMMGLVQFFGLVVFLLVALSGIVLFWGIQPGQKAQGIVHTVKEFHETGLFFISLFLTLHVGGVIMHALHGRHNWRRMFFLNRSGNQSR